MKKKRFEANVHNARIYLLLMITLTVINIAGVFVDVDTMVLYCAYVPFFFTVLGYWNDWYLLYIAAAAIIAIYIACWWFAKKNYRWMFAATVLYIIDTCAMMWVFSAEMNVIMIIGVLMRLCTLYFLISGSRSGFKLQRDLETLEEEEKAEEDDKNVQISATPLRKMEETKARILLEGQAAGMQIVYRRVKKVNELIVNGYVYDEYEALLEFPHTLRARVDAHVIEMEYNSQSRIILRVDGELIKSKVRMI